MTKTPTYLRRMKLGRFPIVDHGAFVRRGAEALLLLALCGAAVFLATGCKTSCEDLQQLADQACALDSTGPACIAAKQALALKSCPETPTTPPTTTPPTTTPPTTLPPTPSPVPTPVPLIPDEELTAGPETFEPQMWLETSAAADRWRAAHRGLWIPEGTHLQSPALIDVAYDGIALELATKGILGVQSWNEGERQRSDCLFVNRPGTNEYEEIKLFEYGGGGMATDARVVKGLWLRNAQPAPPVAECPDPDPTSAYWAPVCVLGGFWDVHPHTLGRCDATWNCGLYYDETVEKLRAHEFCTAVGLGYMGDVPRGTCPVRPDGHPDRPACERKLHGTPLWRTDGVLDVNPANPWQAGCERCTRLEVCWADGTHCKDVLS